MVPRITVTIDPEHMRAALEALELLERSAWCSRYKAARKGLAGAIYSAVQRDLDADGLPAVTRPAVLRLQAG